MSRINQLQSNMIKNQKYDQLSQNQALIFKLRIQKKLKMKFKYIRLTTVNDIISIQFDERTDKINTIKQYIRSELQLYHSKILSINIDKNYLNSCEQYASILSEIEHQIIFDKNQFLKKIQILEDGFPNAHNFYKRETQRKKYFLFFILMGNQQQKYKLIDFLQSIQGKQLNPPIQIKQSDLQKNKNQNINHNVPMINIDLQLNNQKLFLAHILKILNEKQFQNIIKFDQNDKLFIRGSKNKCIKFKKYIKQELKRYKMLILQQKYIESINQLKNIIPAEADFQIIDFKTSEVYCNQIIRKYNIDQPLIILKQIKREKGEFLTFVYLKKIEQKVRTSIYKYCRNRIAEINQTDPKNYLSSKQSSQQIIQEWYIQIPQILRTNLKKRDITNLIQGIIQKQMNDLNILQFLKNKPERLKGDDKIGYRINFNYKKKDFKQNLKNSFCKMLSKTLEYGKLNLKINVDQIYMIKGIEAKIFYIIGYDDDLYLISQRKLFAEKYRNLLDLIDNAKISKQVKIQHSIYYLIKDEIQKIKSQHSYLRFQQKNLKDEFLLNIHGLWYFLQNIMNIIELEIKKTENLIDHDHVVLNKAEAGILKQKGIIQNLKKQYEIDMKIRQIKNIGLQIQFDNHSKINLSTLTLDDVLSKIKVINNQKDLNHMKSIEWTSFQNNLKNIENQVQKYDQQRYIYFLNDQKLNLTQIFTKISSKNASVALYYNNKLKSIKQFLLILYQFIATKSQMQTITICCRDQLEKSQMQKIIKQITLQKSFQNLAQSQVWCQASQSGKLVAFKDITNKKIIQYIKKKTYQFILNQEDIQETKITHNYHKKQKTLWSRSSGIKIPISIVGSKYSYTIDNNQYQFSRKIIQKIQQEKDNEVQLGLSLFKIVIQKNNIKTGQKRNIFTGEKKSVKYEKKMKTSLYKQKKFKVLDLDNMFYLQFSADQTKMKKINTIKYKIKQQLKKSKNIKYDLLVNKKDIPIKQIQKICESSYLTLDPMKIKFLPNQKIQIPIYAYEKRYIQQFKNKLDYIILQIKNKIQFPKYWQQNQSDVQNFKVSPFSLQFQSVQLQFKFKIKSLVRIQNTYLWKQYQNSKKELTQLSNSNIKQMKLFHGTSKTNPNVIYNDKQQAFNINYASENNVFGRGIYFAQESNYSKQYAYCDNGSKYMLYCNVLVGFSEVKSINDQDNTIKDTNFRDSIKKIRYESIKSNYGNSDIYIIYKSRRAYPEYLIQF